MDQEAKMVLADTKLALRELNEHLGQIANQLVEANELKRQIVRLTRDDFEMRNDPKKFLEQFSQMVPEMGKVLRSVGDEEKPRPAAVTSVPPRDPRKRNH
jgi:hypothetical protein